LPNRSADAIALHNRVNRCHYEQAKTTQWGSAHSCSL
jgi:hypothetical protein